VKVNVISLHEYLANLEHLTRLQKTSDKFEKRF
jgi:hypothetical protein